MFAKTIAWCVVYPTTVLMFAVTSLVQILWFLFNSPVDVWNMLD